MMAMEREIGYSKKADNCLFAISIPSFLFFVCSFYLVIHLSRGSVRENHPSRHRNERLKRATNAGQQDPVCCLLLLLRRDLRIVEHGKVPHRAQPGLHIRRLGYKRHCGSQVTVLAEQHNVGRCNGHPRRRADQPVSILYDPDTRSDIGARLSQSLALHVRTRLLRSLRGPQDAERPPRQPSKLHLQHVCAEACLQLFGGPVSRGTACAQRAHILPPQQPVLDVAQQIVLWVRVEVRHVCHVAPDTLANLLNELLHDVAAQAVPLHNRCVVATVHDNRARARARSGGDGESAVPLRSSNFPASQRGPRFSHHLPPSPLSQ
eukprot:Rhum_TRINITY_DN9332_c0_g1::Rhum_TRINITY_DN9332_c0_g1_i1::g.32971::m.32971